MGRLQLGAAILVLLAPSYPGAQVPEGLLGGKLPAVDGGPPAASTIGSAKGLAPGEGGSAARYGRALGALRPEGRAATRGAKETQVYQQASPSVVLIVSDDGLGSGALIGADGTIVTNMHVVGDADEVGVIFKPAQEGAAISKADVRMAKVVRRDELTDLALVRVAEVPAGVKPLAVGSLAGVQVGADVHAIGHPTGQSWTYTRGIVSQIRRDYAWKIEDGLERKANVIQTQTPINPGNSGGPLLDDTMAIIGINSFVSEGEGLNFAVSADDVKALLARKDDRMLPRATKAKAASKKPPACEHKALDSRRTEKDDGDQFLVDGDCDGAPDYILQVPDDKKKPTVVAWDDDGDGTLDSLTFDEDRDGNPDYALYDTDNNGKSDMEGVYRDGEAEPYRYERIKEE